jgi:hypothetical protein
MNRKEFLSRVSTGLASFRIDDVSVIFPDHTAQGAGTLELSDDRFGLKLRLAQGVPVPDFRGGLLTRKDFGSAHGVIEHDLKSEVKNLPPYQQHSISNGASTLHYLVDAIELSPSGSDIQTYDQIREMLRRLESAEPQETASAAAEKKEEASDATFSGLLRGFNLIARNGGTTIEERNDFLGKTKSSTSDTQYGDLSDKWEYGLIERGEHLEFHLRLKDGCESPNAEADLIVLHAFLEAIAFIHGQHAWPFTLEFRRDGRLITDRVRPPKIPKKSLHKPFNERIWFNSRVGNIQWDFSANLQMAYNFFYRNDEPAAEVKKLLFLCREAAGEGIHSTISNIALCSLLDSAVNLVFEQKIEKQLTDRLEAFNFARSKLLHVIAEQLATAAHAAKEAWSRFQTIVCNSDFYAAREKFHAVGEYLGLRWEGDWEDIFRFWSRWRPKLVHRGSADDTGEEAVAAHFNVSSRVTGAIHMLVLKLMGYEGVMVSSTFEDQVRRI